MKILPVLKRLKDKESHDSYATTYEQCSRLTVPQEYLKANQVFGIYLKRKLIGGFILGCGAPLRTIDYFANKENHFDLYQQMGAPNTFTEICCFWIDESYRKKTMVNYFIWIAMAYSLKRYGTENIVFGTNSRRLAALYSTTARTLFLHQDRINKKRTFIFTAKRKGCVLGILEIIYFKLKRKLKLSNDKRTISATMKSKRQAA